DWPIGSMAIFQVSLEIEVAVPIALASPHQRTPPHVVPAIPVETFYLNIGAFFFIDPEIEVFFIQRVIPAEYRVIFDHLLRTSTTVGEIPRVFGRRRIILHMLYITTPLQHDGLEPFLGQLFCSPATA